MRSAESELARYHCRDSSSHALIHYSIDPHVPWPIPTRTAEARRFLVPVPVSAVPEELIAQLQAASGANTRKQRKAPTSTPST